MNEWKEKALLQTQLSKSTEATKYISLKYEKNSKDNFISNSILLAANSNAISK